MIFRPLQPHVTNRLTQINASGISSGCPFCMARERKELAPSDRIVLLAGSRAGHIFEISSNMDVATGRFLAHDLSTQEVDSRMVNSHSEMYLKFPLPDIPTWALPLGVEDNCIVDDVLMRIASDASNFGSKEFDLQRLQHLISFVWRHRLPVTPLELVSFLEAHGHHNSLLNETEKLIRFGIELLTWSHARRPIKRRRTAPFANFRYAKDYRSTEMQNISSALYGPSVNYSDLLTNTANTVQKQ